MVTSLTLHKSSSDDKILGLTNTIAQATRPYTRISTKAVRKGSNQSGGGSMVEFGVEVVKWLPT
jgi:hypothetical protein